MSVQKPPSNVHADVYKGLIVLHACAGPESFVRGGPNLKTFFSLFVVDERIEDPNTTINGPSSARQRNAN